MISCWDDEEWERLCKVAEKRCWLTDARFQTARNRQQHERELNQLIASWTQEQEARRLARRLQARGVHAAQVNTVRDLFTDPQIAFRDIWQKKSHPEIGDHNYRMVSYHLSETPGSVRRHAPCLAEDNEEVFLNVMGLSERTYQELCEQGVFS